MAKRCFVIQGFGKKQDYEQGKQFDLDASYRVIKEAVEKAGLACYRADDLSRNAVIDQVMYDQLLEADLVIADITTLNFNAAYELGVRLALRPYATLIVGEKGMNFPFDIKHIYIHTYHHLGEDIGYQEVKRFQKELTALVKKAASSSDKDSPVYTYLNQLPITGFLAVAKQAQKPQGQKSGGSSLRKLMDQAKTAMQKGHFLKAIALWQKSREVAGKNDYIIQQLALATYKSAEPTAESALRAAKTILEYLKPQESFDAETLGLWAAVHKRLFEITKEAEALDQALFALERGFFIKQDYYNGINLAFMLDTKAAQSDQNLSADLRAVARYVRRNVIGVCGRALEARDLNEDNKYWILATLCEAYVGLGQEDDAQLWGKKANKAAKSPWMKKSAEDQIARLRVLLA